MELCADLNCLVRGYCKWSSPNHLATDGPDADGKAAKRIPAQRSIRSERFRTFFTGSWVA
jgi:hypothetical protein